MNDKITKPYWSESAYSNKFTNRPTTGNLSAVDQDIVLDKQTVTYSLN
jgi:hypothetical protein